MDKTIKLLFMADTHLGFDDPLHPRIQRRRRGADFFSNYQLVLDTARKGNYDLVIHGGDLFFRSKVSVAIVERAYQPLLKAANSGIQVALVPGNHERSRLPSHLWLAHDNIHIFDKPGTFLLKFGERSIALSGFPFQRKVKDRFPDLLKGTGYQDHSADVHFLCLHQTFEGAQVGPVDYTFRTGPDNIPGEWVPEKFSAVLSGHIHRGQMLRESLENKALAVPIIYPGSIERTSFAERFEEKYFVSITLSWDEAGVHQHIEYHQLTTRPMVKLDIPVEDRNLDEVMYLIRDRLAFINPDAVVRINLTGQNRQGLQKSLTAPGLRGLAPKSMNVSLGKEWVFQKQV